MTENARIGNLRVKQPQKAEANAEARENMKTRIFLATTIAMIGGLFGVLPVHGATIYTYSFSGEIAFVSDNNNLLQGTGIELGTLFEGTLSYIDSPEDLASGSTIGLYEFGSNEIAGLSLSIGSNVISRTSDDNFFDQIRVTSSIFGSDFDVSLGDNRDDYVPWESDADLLTRSMGFYLRGGTSATIPSDKLTDITNLVLSDFSSSRFSNMIFADANDLNRVSRVDGIITSLQLESAVSVVPIPAAAWLFASALGVVGYSGWRRKKV